MKHNILNAFEIYKTINGAHRDFEKIPEIFSADVIGGNVACGRLQGLEALSIIYRANKESGFSPEDYLWQMVSENTLAFRFRFYGGKKYDSPYFEGVGELVFDPSIAKFTSYFGMFDVASDMKVMAVDPERAKITGKHISKAIDATKRYQQENPGAIEKLQSASTLVAIGGAE